MKQLAKLLIIVTLFPALSFAQGRRGGFGAGRARGGPFQMDERTALNLFSALLNLNDAQQQQLQTAFDAAVKTAAPIATRMESNKDALFEAVKSGKTDDQIKALATQQGSLTSQMLALQAQTFSKMWALLTSDQKSQVDASMYDDIGEFLANAKQPLPQAGTRESPGGPPK
jgi:LTXXQ motif family protein